MGSIEQIQVLHYGVAGIYQLIKLAFLASFGYWGVDYFEYKIRRALVRVYPDELRLSLIGSMFAYTARLMVLAALLYECGVNASSLLAVLGIGGIAVGYAAKTGVANVISGLFLMLEQPFAIGDTLLIDGQGGVITAVNLFSVTVRMSDRVVRVPHDYLLKNITVKMRK